MTNETDDNKERHDELKKRIAGKLGNRGKVVKKFHDARPELFPKKYQ